ncbi:MAG: helix-turn-helix domain-containing protein, partial [Oscillospiraceae bacterium]|nr:helix-turn-helix domain-containing protein [Oscillospiraceae bacterium]
MAGKYKYLTLEDRRLIANMLNDCRPAAMIAHTLGVSAETVY